MKTKGFRNDWSRKSHEEFVIFYSMCGKADRTIFDAPSKNCSPEDSARLLTITLAFGFRKMALRILSNINVDDSFLHSLDELKGNGPLMMNWFDDFVREIPIPEFKELAVEVWEKKRKEILAGDTDIRNLL